MKRTSDKSLTLAFCVSLLVHAGLWVLSIREQVAVMTRQLTWPPLVDAHKINVVPHEEGTDNDPPAVIVEPPAPLAAAPFTTPPPPLPPPAAQEQKRPDESFPDSEWGEKDAKGVAITSAPGDERLQARKGIQDQAFSSRDPKGPGPFPDEPSMSVVPPGENGDGRPVRDPLAGAGTEGAPEVVVGRPETNSTPPPPPPPPDRPTAVASGVDGPANSEASGQAMSRLPAAEQRSPAEGSAPWADVDGPANSVAVGPSLQLLPIKRIDVIAVRSAQQAYPEVVPALTQPPDVRIARLSPEPAGEVILPDVVTADVPSATAIQPATVAFNISQRQPEEMARLVGESDPDDGPMVTEALTQLPSDTTTDGGAAPLPELAPVDVAAAPAVQDAIPAFALETPPVEMAQLIEEPASGQPVAVLKPSQGQAGSAASASGGAPGPAVAAADPAADTGLESDPFSKLPGIQFRDGKVEAKNGRVVKPIRPRLTEAGRRDLLALQFPTILLKVRIDKSGKPTDVTVIRGSGSEAIDMPVYRALWGWWFEPPTDKAGAPMEDVQLVSIHWS